MAGARDIRRLAFQTLFQLDARPEHQDEVLAGVETPDGFTDGEVRSSLALAQAAYESRDRCDAAMAELAPEWPAYRLAPVDRAILRLAYHEMHAGTVNPKIAVNEAIELAKGFSTDKSPAFVNGLLDKVLKEVLRATEDAAPVESEPGAVPPTVGVPETPGGSIEG